jgi:hypothetical protein
MQHATTLNPPRRAMHYLQLVSTTGVSGGMIAIGAVVGDWPGDNAQLQHVIARAGWVALRAHRVRVAGFGVRQPCCRAGRTHDPARVTPFPILVTEKLDVIVSIIESVRHACDTCT